MLWNCVDDAKKVRTILNELEDKSMVVKNWRLALETDVYEVHSVLLSYLRRQQSQDEVEVTMSHNAIVSRDRCLGRNPYI